ncbi:hypothetical protein IMZ48_23720 [Candidatus Bathyarchaeota archaeon]|nr:hypothetical protein [Candidatus Bathyarchaeota archaeon]
MLLIALEVENIEEAADCIVHVRYSALIHESDLVILQQRVRPHIQHVCDRLKGEEEDANCSMDWPFGYRTLRVGLQKSQWDKLLSFVSVPVGLTAMRARKIRLSLTLHPMGKDFRDWHVLYQSPAGRLAKRRFREDGLLLPYGHPRHKFVHPNP